MKELVINDTDYSFLITGVHRPRTRILDKMGRGYRFDWLRVHRMDPQLESHKILPHSFDDNPAIIRNHLDSRGRVIGVDKQWMQYGKVHRRKGPAIILNVFRSEIHHWYRYGEAHRIGGPQFKSRIAHNWKQFGQFHRIDGPAEESSGTMRYFLHGIDIPMSDFRRLTSDNPETCAKNVIREIDDLIEQSVTKSIFHRDKQTVLLHIVKVLEFNRCDARLANAIKAGRLLV